MTVRPANPGEPLPELVLASRQAIIEEAEELRAGLDDFSRAPQPGCPQELDGKAWSDGTGPQAEARRKLLALTQHQALLICSNAYDHLSTLGRALGSDGAMSLFAHSTLSRVVCEAAVRFAWILDSDVGCEERIMRGAVALLISADERLKGASKIPAGRFGPRLLQRMIEGCAAERDAVQGLITDAGVAMALSGDGKKIARLELDSPKVAVRAQLEVTSLMTDLLPDSPSWYNSSSAVTHSQYWGLRDAVASAVGTPLALTPNLMEVAAAAQCAISACGLIIERHAAYYGHDPQAHIRRTRERREALNPYMLRLAIS